MSGVASAKAILLGEHTVVNGGPALLVGLRPGMEARVGAAARTLTIQVAPWNLEARAGDATGVGRALTALDEALGAAGIEASTRHREVYLTAAVPPRAGVGSSAALAIALVRAIAEKAGRDDVVARAEEIASVSEVVFHGSPSGADAAICARGGVGVFHRDSGFTGLTPGQDAAVVVADSGPRPLTREMVARVQEKRETSPTAKDSLEELARLARQGADALVAGDLPAVGGCMDEAHTGLASLSLSTPRLDALVEAARSAGALGAKLTGAGGGGCIVALCTRAQSATVESALAAKADWARAFPVEANP